MGDYNLPSDSILEELRKQLLDNEDSGPSSPTAAEPIPPLFKKFFEE